MRALCFATGNLYRFFGKFALTDLFSSLVIQGVEWTYGKNFGERPLTEKDVNFLRTLDYVSLHAPFRFGSEYYSNDEISSGLKSLSLDYSKIKAKCIVVHPNRTVPRDFFKKSNMLIVTENLNPRRNDSGRKRLGFEKVLNLNPDDGLCLDVSHAYLWSENETGRIVKKWKHRIKQVHFSNTFRGADHLSFKKISARFLKSIEPLRELEVPIIIEEDMNSCSLTSIKSEIKLIKKILSF